MVDSNRFLIVLSICVAALIWIVVAMTAGRADFKQEFKDVPVDISLKTEEFIKLGLNPIEVSTDTVMAIVEGDRVAITGQTANTFEATVELPDNVEVGGPGTYSLAVVPADTDYDRSLYTSITYEPKTILVKFDKLVSKTFPIKANINGMSVAAGYIQGEQTISPTQVTIRGPQTEVEKIQSCVISMEMIDPLERTHDEDYPIQVLDVQGQEIDLEASHLTIDYTEARLVIEVKPETSIGLTVDFTNIPRGFPISELRYSMTADTIQVGVPADELGKKNDILLGLIDVRTINKDSYTYTFPVELPENYIDVDTIKSVTVKFFPSGWDETLFMASGIELLNVPDNYDVKILGGETIYNIKFVGKREILEEMTSDDIIMEIDFSEREIVPGQTQVPVKISAPTKGMVWATGVNYSVVLQVTEKEES